MRHSLECLNFTAYICAFEFDVPIINTDQLLTLRLDYPVVSL
jgi:hypothetical protein